jgi:branched-chain amino acid aminotransferase
MVKGIVFMDGKFLAPEEARMSIFDSGFVNSDAVFDVVSVWDGSFFRLEEHLARFERSCAGFRLPLPYSTGEIRRILAECVSRAGLESSYVKMQLTRGISPIFSGFQEPQSQFVAYAVPYLWIWGEEKCRNGAAIRVSSVERVSSRAIDQRFKNYNRADMVRARLEAQDQGADDAVLLDSDGCLTEGLGWNICIVRNGAVASPDRDVLEGETRRAVAELCAREGIVMQVRPVRAAELEEATEVFGTTTAGGVMPIVSVDGRVVGDGLPGPLTRLLQGLYWREREAGWLATPVADILRVEPAAREVAPR